MTASPPPKDKIQRGLELQRTGSLNEAKQAYEAIIAEHPDFPDAYHLLGLLLFQAGHAQQGLALVQESVNRAPDNLTFLDNFIKILSAQKLWPQALEATAHLLDIPDGDTPDNQARLADLFIMLGRLDDAMSTLTALVERAPGNAVGLRLLGRVHIALGNAQDAVEAYERALKLNPNAAINHYNLGNALSLVRALDRAESAYAEAIRLDDTLAEAHARLGMVKMLRGDLSGGWPEYEWRWKGEGFPNRQAPGPLWDGARLNGGTLLLTTEQGFGDAFQFARYAVLAKECSGARTVIEAQAPIAALMGRVPGVDDVVTRGKPLPPFDAQAPLMTLPGILGTTLDTIPVSVPYLTADDVVRQRWSAKLAALPGLKAGIAWRGNPDQLHNIYRSCPVAALRPLLDIEGVTWVGLQKDPTADELAALPGLVDCGRSIETFDDTAAIMAELDLVISVCTSVAHMAGGLARPVWVMLSAGSDWRWFLERPDSPWYPTARLFRQNTMHDWNGVIGNVAAALAAQIETGEIPGA